MILKFKKLRYRVKTFFKNMIKYPLTFLVELSDLACCHAGTNIVIEEQLSLLQDEGFEGLEEVYLCRCICRCGKTFERRITFRLPENGLAINASEKAALTGET